MEINRKINRCTIAAFSTMYIVCVICMFMFHPIVASAAEKVPGGVGNVVDVNSYYVHNGTGREVKSIATMKAADDWEIVAFLRKVGTDPENPLFYSVLFWQFNPSSGQIMGLRSSGLDDYVGVKLDYHSGELYLSYNYTASNPLIEFDYANISMENEAISCSVTGCKIFKDQDAMLAYAESGNLDGLVKDEYQSDWYLKDIRLKVTADDSPTSEAGEDATYIQFNWLTDNLQEGDLLEIRTHNYLKKIGSDQISGFHDFITWTNNVSAYDDVFTDKDGNERASYTISQYDATKAWFSTLDNKPLIFKSYDTDIYYFRPYRNGVYGRWCKVTMGRSTPTSSPYIEDIEIGDIDEDGNWDKSEDLTDENGGNHGVDQGGDIIQHDPDNPFEGTNLSDWSDIFMAFFNFMKDIPSLLGDLPALVNTTIGFLPSWVIGFIGIGIIVVIILRIIGR